ncbi:uncharacterized protein DNG_08040 [Cephalotrichum gorgonifer]|uniref:Uncharacterized protein n=1 Tax=Cephalotrichum gorgonifer TaxID=2041049 RepID=A0AAE8SY46_9PEZI|nr:uncharacterized protein DNG_08040 [Cephalotrichum gorgonifer]
MAETKTTRRSSSISSTTSVWTDASGADWIAPAEAAVAPTSEEHHSEIPRRELPRPGSEHGPARRRRISSALDADEANELWLRMVELQQRYGCYRSARMQAAVSAAHAADLMPSNVCLDLLNDDVTEEELPEEAWRILGRFVVEEDAAPAPRSGKDKVWWKM